MEETVIRYARGKAIGFGLVMLALGAAMVWVAVEVLETVAAMLGNGALLQGMPTWSKAPLVVVLAAAMLTPAGAAILWAGMTGRVIVRADAAGIAARTIFGRVRRIKWADIAGVKRQQNRIVLSPAGVDTIDQRIWDRRSVLLDVWMLEGGPAAIEALIRRYRPELEHDRFRWNRPSDPSET